MPHERLLFEAAAREIGLPDPEENLGAQVLREAAEKTGQPVGDDTSPSAVLAYDLFAEGMRNVAARAREGESRELGSAGGKSWNRSAMYALLRAHPASSD